MLTYFMKNAYLIKIKKNIITKYTGNNYIKPFILQYFTKIGIINT